MSKLSFSIIVLLLLVIIAGAYKFIYKGKVTNSEDGRTAIVLLSSEKDQILEEMRGFLSASQQIIQAVSDDDMPSVVAATKKWVEPLKRRCQVL